MTQLNFRTYQIALIAGQEHEFGVPGNMYAIVDSTGQFTITFDESQRITKAEEGTGGEFPETYNRVTLLSTTSQNVTIILGFGKYHDARATVNATVNTTISPSNTLANPADVTVGVAATVIAAADANRKEIMIHVPSDAANSIRIGSASVAAGAGIEVEPGTTFVLATESAVYGIRDGVADVDVSILDLSRP